MRRRELLKLSLLAAALPAFSLKAQESLDSLAREAFIYLYPMVKNYLTLYQYCLLYTSPSPRDRQKSRMPSSA